MIDPKAEKLIHLSDVPSLDEVPRRKERSVHRTTVYAWANRGVRGVKLEIVQRGGQKFTSVEAVLRFFERIAEPRLPRTAGEAKRATAHADAFLDSEGF